MHFRQFFSKRLYLQNKKYFLTRIYCSPSQNHKGYENFCVRFDLLLSNINNELAISSIFTRDFNVCSSNWWKSDITNTAGRERDCLTSSAWYLQIIDKLTYTLNNSISCIGFIFCTNANVISKHGVDASVLEKYHHIFIFDKVELYVPPTPVYVREVWDYSKKNAENINKAISNVNWNKRFLRSFDSCKSLTFEWNLIK